jgi:hypothetical protein
MYNLRRGLAEATSRDQERRVRLGSASNSKSHAKRPLNHSVSPRIGFLNLLGSPAPQILEEDKAALAPLFASSQESETDPPVCDVPMIYANVQSDGSIVGYSGGLRDIIREANSPIAIVASESEAKGYLVAGKPTGYGQANLVMTLKRKGANFPRFFVQLFIEMFRGRSMPMAWVKLAPQGGKTGHEYCPEAIFVAEISHIILE